MFKHLLVFLGFIILVILPSNSRGAMEYAGTIGGEVRCVEVYETDGRTYAYIAQGGALVVYETTDPYHPREVNRIYPASGKIYDIALGDRFLAVVMGEQGTYIYSLDDPVELTLASSINVLVTSIQVSGFVVILHGSSMGSTPSSSYIEYWVYSVANIYQPVTLEHHGYGGYLWGWIPSFYMNHPTLSLNQSMYYRFNNCTDDTYPEYGFYRMTLQENRLEGIHINIPRFGYLYFKDELLMGKGEDTFNIYDISTDEYELLYEYPMSVYGNILVDGDYAYVKSATDYAVFDISDARNINFYGRIEFLCEPVSIHKNIVYSIDSKDQLVLQHIEGLNVEEASRIEKSIGNVFCLASGEDCIYASEYWQDGEGFFSEINILTGCLENFQTAGTIILDGYFPYIYAQNEWLLVDNSEKMYLFDVTDFDAPELVWELDHFCEFPKYYQKDPSFVREYSLLFEYPYIIISHNQTLTVYEIVDGNVVLTEEKELDWGCAALHYENGLLYGMKVVEDSATGFVVFDLTAQGAPVIHDGEEYRDVENSMEYGCIEIVDDYLYHLHYGQYSSLLRQFDIHTMELVGEYGLDFFSVHQFYRLAEHSHNLHLMECREYAYEFMASISTQKLCQLNIEDPSNPSVSGLVSLPPALEPPITFHDNHLLIPGRDAGIYVFRLKQDGTGVEEWMLHGE